MKKLTLVLGFIALLICALFFLEFSDQPTVSESLKTPTLDLKPNDAFFNSAIRPIPLNIPLNPDKVLLGEKLFHETRLSQDNTLSCASCHDLINMGGTVNTAKAIGVNGQTGKRNPPTVFNTASNFVLHWEGKFNTLETQIGAPLKNPSVMGSNWPTVLAALRTDPFYVEQFAQLYAEEVISIATVSDAIATFERSLYTPDARFDQYLRGNKSALSDQEKEGYQLFSTLGCISCHQGINIGGNLYQKLGIFKPFKPKMISATPDLGRFHITGNEDDKFVFRVPSLRNIAKTAPYFHDGSIARLEEAIEIMAEHQLGRTLSETEVADIAAFLESLTGTYRGEPL